MYDLNRSQLEREGRKELARSGRTWLTPVAVIFLKPVLCVCEGGSQNDSAVETFPQGSLWLVL